MAQDITDLLRRWPFSVGELLARELTAEDGRTLLQLRIDLGLMQLELSGRPDGEKPHGHPTYLDYLKHLAVRAEAGKPDEPRRAPSSDIDDEEDDDESEESDELAAGSIDPSAAREEPTGLSASTADEAAPGSTDDITGASSDDETPVRRHTWLSAKHWNELDRELIQFYHRRLCLLSVASAALSRGDSDRARDRFTSAVSDATHSLACMDFVAKYGPNDEFIEEHEQHRPVVVWHRGFAQSQIHVAEKDIRKAIEALESTQEHIRKLYEEHSDEPGGWEQDVQVQMIRQLIEHLRSEHQLMPSLQEQLALAISQENYELAAELRDRILQQGEKLPSPEPRDADS